MVCPKFFGKYRGKVENNKDEGGLGRLQVSVPSVLGEGKMSWALPCMPFAGPEVGFFAIPPQGANVWVEFEGGDPDYPIWTGCFWDTSDPRPVPSANPQVMAIKTDAGSIIMDSSKNSISLENSLGLKISFSEKGIEITNGKTTGQDASITLAKDGRTVSINGGALQVD